MAESKSTKATPPVGARIIAGLAEFEQALKGKEPIAKRFTVRTVELNLEPREYPGDAIRETRDLLRVSQAVFAELLGVSVYAVRAWEQGQRNPPKIARRLMDEIQANPSAWIKLLNGALHTVAT